MPRTSITKSSPVSGRSLRFRTRERIVQYQRRHQYDGKLLRPRHKTRVRHRHRRGPDRRHQSLQQVQLRRPEHHKDCGLVVRGVYLPNRRSNAPLQPVSTRWKSSNWITAYVLVRIDQVRSKTRMVDEYTVQNFAVIFSPRPKKRFFCADFIHTENKRCTFCRK